MEMPVTVDEAEEQYLALVENVRDRLEAIQSEQDARLQLINRILTEVLGWQFADIKTESHSESGYTDYVLHSKGTPCFVVEAKRTGTALIDTANTKVGTYKVAGPALKSAGDGIRQATGYCMDYGVDFACVTTGVTWVCFIAFPGAGRSYKDSKAIVFPDFAAVAENFAYFYDLLSYESVTKRLYKARFAKAEGLTASNFEALSAVNRTADLKMMPKTALAQDLDPIFREFFGIMSGSRDRDMLIECFVETRESRSADEALKKLIGHVSAEVETLSTETGRQLVEKISFAVESGYGENILIVGNKGAGKSTFVERFFKIVLDSSIRSKCVLINVDLLDFTGDVASLHQSITTRVQQELEKALFISGIPKFDELQGIYFSEYQRWSEGQYKHLYDSDRTAFKIKFGDFVDNAMNSDPYSYVTHLLDHIVASRKLLPCFVFDNADHFDVAFQEAVFQWSQAIHRHVSYSLIILPVTDRTIWRLSKSGPFQTYRSKLFYLPVPSAKDVLRKRVDYLKAHSDVRRGNEGYFFRKGIRLTLQNIHAFAACMEEIFIQEDFISRRIGWLCNHDIRRSLVLSQAVVTSPFLSVDDLVAAYIAKGSTAGLSVSYTKFMQALVLGSYNNFQQDESPFVLNLFSISADFPSSPLLKASVLKLLIDKAGLPDEHAGYIPLSQMLLYFGSMGASEEAVTDAFKVLLEFRLVEPFDASSTELVGEQRLAITHSGRVHYEMLTTDLVYIGLMSFATAIRAESIVGRLKAIKTGRMSRAEWAEVRRTFALYCLAEDRTFIRVPKDEMFEGQRQLRRDLFGRWVTDGQQRTRGEATAGGEEGDAFPQRSAGAASPANHLNAVVKWFDPIRGFGFIEDGSGKDIFVHITVVRRAEIELLSEGDQVTCDVVVDPNGRRQVIQIHSVEPGSAASVDMAEMIPAKIAFYNPSKGYGFVSLGDGGDDAYLPARVMNEGGYSSFPDGQAVSVLVVTKAEGRGRVITKLKIAAGELAKV
jgi:cold shock CspA family protein/energy-coupling factor transporter ATP-binding protein EcfA2